MASPVEYSVLGLCAESKKLKVKFFNPYEGFDDYDLLVDVPRKEDGTIDMPLLTSTLNGIATSQEESMRLEYQASLPQNDAEEIFGEVNETEEESNGED